MYHLAKVHLCVYNTIQALSLPFPALLPYTPTSLPIVSPFIPRWPLTIPRKPWEEVAYKFVTVLQMNV